MADPLYTPPLRLSYPFLFALVDCRTVSQRKNNDPPKMRCRASLIYDAVSAAHPDGQKLFMAIAQEVRNVALQEPKMRTKAQGLMTKKLWGIQDSSGDPASSGIRSPFKDGGSDKFGTFDADGRRIGFKDGYGPGTIVFDITSNRSFLDKVVNRAGKLLPNEEDAIKMFYAGCYVRAAVRVRAYTQEQLGLSIDADALQFVQDGERLGGGGDPEALMGALDAAEPGDINAAFGGLR